MLVKRYASQHVPIYLQPFPSNSTRKFKIYSLQNLAASIFNRLRAIVRYWSEIATFSYPLHLTPPLGCSQFPLEFRGKFIPQKTRIMGLPGSEDAV